MIIPIILVLFLAVRHFLSDILLGFSPAAAADEVINKPPHTSLGSQHVLCALVKKLGKIKQCLSLLQQKKTYDEHCQCHELQTVD